MNINTIGLSPQELLAVKEGIKPVLRTGVNPENIDIIKKFCRKQNLYVLIKSTHETSIKDSISTYPNYILYISLSENLTKKAFEAEKSGNEEELGELLGYPECCIDFYLDTVTKRKFPFPIHTFLNTKGKLSFYINNIFKLDTRLGSKESRRIISESPEFLINVPPFYLISHIPCSFNCRESVENGKKILKILKNETPNIAEKIVYTLKKIFLFFDDFNWIVFEGRMKNNELEYNRVLPYRSLFPEEDIIMIENGNRIKAHDDSILVMKNDKILSRILKEDRRKGIIMDFS